MDKNKFEEVAEMYVEYICDRYDSGLYETPEKLKTKNGYLEMFQEWLKESKNGDGLLEHVLEHFNEVSAEEYDPDDDPGAYIPVIK